MSIWTLTFSDWNNYQDGDGNDHTLDWSSAVAMRGRPAYPYMEAIRQGINERFPPRADWRPYSSYAGADTRDFSKTCQLDLLGNEGLGQYSGIYVNPPPGGYYTWIYTAFYHFLTGTTGLPLNERAVPSAQSRELEEYEHGPDAALGWMPPKEFITGNTLPPPYHTLGRPVMTVADLLSWVNVKYGSSYTSIPWLNDDLSPMVPYSWRNTIGNDGHYENDPDDPDGKWVTDIPRAMLPRADWFLQIYRMLNCLTHVTPMGNMSIGDREEKSAPEHYESDEAAIAAFNAAGWSSGSSMPGGLYIGKILYEGRNPWYNILSWRQTNTWNFPILNIHDRPVSIYPYTKFEEVYTDYPFWQPDYPDNGVGDWVYNGTGSYDNETGVVTARISGPTSISEFPPLPGGSPVGTRYSMFWQADMSQAFTFSDSRTE